VSLAGRNAGSGSFWRRISVRVILLSTILVFTALLVAAALLVELYRNGIERRFDALLSSHLFSLVAATSLSTEGRLTGQPQIGEARYRQPETGWVWEVVPASDAVKGRLASPFLATGLQVPPISELPYDDAFERRFLVDSDGSVSKVVETEIDLGGGTQIARFRVAGNLNEIDAETDDFQGIVLLALGTVGALMLAVNAAAIFFGLHPLDTARRQLAKVRSGEADRLTGPFASEIEPLADEINALIENNQRIVGRARVQVGDLAHALKTPLAVMANETASSGDRRGLMREQIDIMKSQIERYLQRARIAAQGGTAAYRTDVGPIVERLARVFGKLNPDLTFNVALPHPSVMFAGEAQDLEEMLGNILENAGKWAKQEVHIILEGIPQKTMLSIEVTDDGPGIPAAQREEALQRGRRLDETKPGSGLGLSIVTELVREYRGTIELGDSTGGGLNVKVVLPLATG
jgi:signal transduction histidine kinase